MFILLFMLSIISRLDAVLYNCYTGKPATENEVRIFKERNNTKYCLIDVKLPCGKEEWRRLDGSCYDFKHPSWGMVRTPTIRVLPEVFSKGYNSRPSKSGRPLPLPRHLRTQILSGGKVSDLCVTQLASFYGSFATGESLTLHDVANYVRNVTICCKPEGKTNYVCIPNKMRGDDPTHRFSGLDCLNLTRPTSFQYFGCADFDTTPFKRMAFVTPGLDLSAPYEPVEEANLRTFEDGLLKTDIEENGQAYPPGDPIIDININRCSQNKLPKETRCHQYHVNGVLGHNMFLIMYYRQHNYIARKLKELNPCWDDERLFFTARDINIAIHTQILFYELYPVYFGRKNMIKEGLILTTNGFRDVYDKTVSPQISDEFLYALRWFHTIQETTLKLYDKDGYFLKNFPAVNMTARTGYLALDDNLGEICRGSYRQLSGGFDHTADYDMIDRGLGNLQFAADVTASDLAKARYFGLPPYIKYREFCSNKTYETFDSLKDVMCKERIHRLSEVYENVEDIDLMAGMWAENLKPGSRVPHTVYCLIVHQLKRFLTSDRHWFERPNRPHGFTPKQREAIGEATVAGVMCTNVDSVTEIQPKAFYRISTKNPLTDCSSPKIGKINLTPWKDEQCGEASQ